MRLVKSTNLLALYLLLNEHIGIFSAEEDILQSRTVHISGESSSASILPKPISSENEPSHQSQQPSSSSQIRSPSAEKLTWRTGTLRPLDLPSPEIFNSFTRNYTVTLSDGGQVYQVAEGSVVQFNAVNDVTDLVSADVAVLSQAMPRESVEEMLKLLRSFQNYDEDPDTVDGMPTYEIFVDTPELRAGPLTPSTKVRDTDPQFMPERKVLRQKLLAITVPILDEVITPFIKHRYPDICARGNGRNCTPCYSLIRRYRHGERQSHATHYDGHAIATAVVSLSDYGQNYLGGLFVSTGYGQRQHLALRKGDAAIHRTTLLHGVQVYDLQDRPEDTERWSWILWYKDSETCSDFSHEWFAECSTKGNALCQHLHATKVGFVPGISEEDAAKEKLRLNTAAAKAGVGGSALKVARTYLQQFAHSPPLDVKKAMYFFQMAINSSNPDGHYGMAQLLLTELSLDELSGANSDRGSVDSAVRKGKLAKVVRHLEEGAMLGHVLSMFNLGIVHVYGYGTPNGRMDHALASEWFRQSGLPEGYFVASQQALSVGDAVRHRSFEERANVLGFNRVWRKVARQNSGSGGVGGTDINLPWPVSQRGDKPPIF